MAERMPVWDQRGPVDQFGRPLLPRPEWIGSAPPEPEEPPTKPPEPEVEPVEPAPPTVWTGPADPLPVPRLPVTRDTPFRSHLDCGEAVWLAEHKRLNSPIPLEQQKRCYAAVKLWSAQVLATGVKETELGKTGKGRNNLFNLFVPGGDLPKDFPSWAAGATEWYARYADATYKQGVYMPRHLSIEQAIAIYQGGPYCWATKGGRCANGETWVPGEEGSIELSIQQFVARVNTYLGHPQKVPWSVVPVRPVVPPPGQPTIYRLSRDFARFGLTKQGADAIRSYCFQNRSGQSVLRILLHVQEGTTPGSLDWWLNGYVKGRKVQASSTVMIQQDGSILEVIDYDDGPWTNGDVCNPDAEGQRFLAQCQGGNPNLFTESAEFEGWWNRSHSNEQLDAGAWWVKSRMAARGLAKEDIDRHANLNRCDRANCCGDIIWNGVMARL